MGSRLNPYISFDGNARQAMEFYRSVFGGELRLRTFGEFGTEESPEAGKIMHGTLETGDGFTIMGADVPPGMEYHGGNRIAVSVSGEDADRLRGFWAKLSERGEVSVPLERQMWGDEFGACEDQFGVSWMVNIARPES